jgi:hypothetical protein
MQQHAGTKGIFEDQDLRCRKAVRAHPVSVSEPSGKSLFSCYPPEHRFDRGDSEPRFGNGRLAAAQGALLFFDGPKVAKLEISAK